MKEGIYAEGFVKYRKAGIDNVIGIQYDLCGLVTSLFTEVLSEHFNDRRLR